MLGVDALVGEAGDAFAKMAQPIDRDLARLDTLHRGFADDST